MHSAGAALSVITSLLSAGEADMIAQCIEEAGAGIERQSMLLTVDRQHHVYGIAGSSSAQSASPSLRLSLPPPPAVRRLSKSGSFAGRCRRG